MIGLSYKTEAFERADKAKQQELLEALGAWGRALRKDECGAWVISGTHGQIWSWSDTTPGWVIHVSVEGATERGARQAWTWAKKRLGFSTVTFDGDDGGKLRLHHLPTPEEGEILRELIGIRKRTEYAAEELERRVALMKSARFTARSAPEPLEASE